VGERGVVGVALGQLGGVVRFGVHGLDDGVHQQAGGEGVGLVLCDPLKGVAHAGGDLGVDAVEVSQGVAEGGGGGVHHAGQGVDLDEGGGAVAGGAGGGGLGDGIGEEPSDDALLGLGVHRGFDEVDPGGTGGGDGDAERGGFPFDAIGDRITGVVLGVDLEPVDGGRDIRCGGGEHAGSYRLR
jgi:hypothetical protein